MYCSNCGQELAPDAKFCSNCGAPVDPGASDSRGSAPSGSERDWGGYSQREGTAPKRSDSGTSSPPPPPANDTFGDGGFADRKPAWEVERDRLRQGGTDEWSLPDPGPTPPRRRRTWLWVLLGLIAFVVLACCVFFYWILATESGTEWFEGIATQAAEELIRATEQAATPVP